MVRRMGQQVQPEGRRFIGRTWELEKISQWLESETADLTLLYISGMGGIGKTSLMSQMAQLGKQRGCACIWLDGRTVTPTPASFLENLSAAASLEQLELETARNHPLRILTDADPGRRALLCIDNFEELATLEGWFLEAFLPKLSESGVAVLMSARPRLSLAWATHPIWGAKAEELRLSYFTREEIHAFVGTYGSFPDETIGRLARLSGGHPLALALSVDSVLQDKSGGTDKEGISQTISARMLRELASAELQPMVDVLTVLPQANQEMLSRLLQRQVSVSQFRKLSSLSFVRIEADGLALHDVARSYLLRDFRQREPVRFRDIQSAAAQLLYKKLKQSDRRERRKIASHMLMLSREMLSPYRGYADFSGDWQPCLQQIEPYDKPKLHALLDEWCAYSTDAVHYKTYHDFLDELTERFPESMAIVRDSQGQAAGMFITVLIHEETGMLLQRYFPNEMAECFKEREWLCTPDEANTYYAVLVAATSRMPEYTREELVGLLTLDRLSLLGDGSRAILVATNDGLKRQLQELGFRLRPTTGRACDVSWARADILELDLRSDNFGDWVLSFFRGNDENQADRLFHRLEPKDQEQHLRKMLLSLHTPAGLESYVNRFEGIRSGVELQRFLLHMLRSEDLFGLPDDYRKVLYAAYWQHAGNPDAAASQCNISRATFYRYLKKAVSNLAQVVAVVQKEKRSGLDQAVKS